MARFILSVIWPYYWNEDNNDDRGLDLGHDDLSILGRKAAFCSATDQAEHSISPSARLIIMSDHFELEENWVTVEWTSRTGIREIKKNTGRPNKLYLPGWLKKKVFCFSSILALQLSLAGNSGRLNWLRLQQPQEQRYPLLTVPAVCSFAQTKVYLSMLGIFNVHTDVNACDFTRGYTDTIRESALKVYTERKKSLAAPGNRTCFGGLPIRRSTNWATSPPHSAAVCPLSRVPTFGHQNLSLETKT